VYLSALNLKINVCNIRKSIDQEILKNDFFDLIITTAECLSDDVIEYLAKDYVFIFDEAHLLFYWGESFRPRLTEVMENVLACAPATFFLSATINDEIKVKLIKQVEYNYEHFYQVNFGNQELKNMPTKIYIYPKRKLTWLLNDLYYSDNKRVKLVFCRYRNQVKEMEQILRHKGFNVLSCIGGEASEFTQKLINIEKLDIIVATSVVSHGVNLPAIEKIYFLYKIDNLDFYLQMIGRGGRDGSSFELHTLNSNYFSKRHLIKGYLAPYGKIVRNKVNSYLYYDDES